MEYWKVMITFDEESLIYLRSLVESGECKNISHATRKIIREHRERLIEQKNRRKVSYKG